MHITISRMENGTASRAPGDQARRHVGGNSDHKAGDAAPRRLSRPPTSAAVNPLRPMIGLCGEKRARAEQHAGQRGGEHGGDPGERQDEVDVDLALAREQRVLGGAAELTSETGVVKNTNMRAKKTAPDDQRDGMTKVSLRPARRSSTSGARCRCRLCGAFHTMTIAAFRMMAMPIVIMAATKVGCPSRRRIIAI